MPSIRELKARLHKSLPEHMVPSAWMFLDALPLTPNGKIDRKALLHLKPGAITKIGSQELPSTRLEALVLAEWHKVLDYSSISINDNFFEIGGTSITGLRFINSLQESFGAVIHVAALFDAPTVSSFARYLSLHYPEVVSKFDGTRQVVQGATNAINEEWIFEFGKRIPPLHARRGRSIKKNPPMAFILSPPRSGSTLLRVMLAGHSRLFAPPELELLPFGNLSERQARFVGRDAFWREGLTRAVMSLTNTSVAEAEKICSRYEASGITIQEFYLLLQKWSNGRLIVDKSPGYSLDLNILRRAEEYFEGAKYIHLTRHPAGMISSFEKSKIDQVFYRIPTGYERRELAELVWIYSHRNILDFLAGVPEDRQLHLRYEDLVTRPDIAATSVCDLLGVPFEESVLNPYDENGDRMTDGLHPESRMLGDVKFHEHAAIRRDKAYSWDEGQPLSEACRSLMRSLGYADPKGGFPRGRGTVSGTTHRFDQATGSETKADVLPATWGQARLVFMDTDGDLAKPSSPTWNFPIAWRCGGRPALVERCLRVLVERHTALRTSFFWEGDVLMQRIHRAEDIFVRHRTLDQGSGSPKLEKALSDDRATPFVLGAAPPVLLTVYDISPDESVACMIVHHIDIDGTSVEILNADFERVYENLTNCTCGDRDRFCDLPATVQFSAFARSQSQLIEDQQGPQKALLAYWRAHLPIPYERLRLGFYPEELDVPYRGGIENFMFPSGFANRMPVMLGGVVVTPFVLTIAAYFLLTFKYSKSQSVSISVPVSGRTREVWRHVVGYLADTHVIRLNLPSLWTMRLDAFIARVQEACVGMIEHQELPHSYLMTCLQPEQGLRYVAPFNLRFAYQNFERSPSMGLQGSIRRLNVAEEGLGGSTRDLAMYLREEDDGALKVGLQFNQNLVSPIWARRLAEEYQGLLTCICAAQQSGTSVTLRDFVGASALGHLSTLSTINTPRT
jgi:hypothetical protein